MQPRRFDVLFLFFSRHTYQEEKPVGGTGKPYKKAVQRIESLSCGGNQSRRQLVAAPGTPAMSQIWTSQGEPGHSGPEHRQHLE
jgi:hypothetical protein